MPIRLVYLAASRWAADSNTSGTGRRSFERIAMRSSSCASQSMALSASARFSGAFCTNRSVAKSELPTATARPCPLPLGAATAASSRRESPVWGKSLRGSIDVASVKAPDDGLESSRGVMVPAPALVVSIVLAQAHHRRAEILVDGGPAGALRPNEERVHLQHLPVLARERHRLVGHQVVGHVAPDADAEALEHRVPGHRTRRSQRLLRRHRHAAGEDENAAAPVHIALQAGDLPGGRRIRRPGEDHRRNGAVELGRVRQGERPHVVGLAQLLLQRRVAVALLHGGLGDEPDGRLVGPGEVADRGHQPVLEIVGAVHERHGLGLRAVHRASPR
jgi:hypothetical protein